jgi:hypothetical protein
MTYEVYHLNRDGEFESASVEADTFELLPDYSSSNPTTVRGVLFFNRTFRYGRDNVAYFPGDVRVEAQ